MNKELIYDKCMGMDKNEAEEWLEKTYVAEFADEYIYDGLDNGDYLMALRMSVGRNDVILYFPRETDIVEDVDIRLW